MWVPHTCPKEALSSACLVMRSLRILRISSKYLRQDANHLANCHSIPPRWAMRDLQTVPRPQTATEHWEGPTTRESIWVEKVNAEGVGSRGLDRLLDKETS